MGQITVGPTGIVEPGNYRPEDRGLSWLESSNASIAVQEGPFRTGLVSGLSSSDRVVWPNPCQSGESCDLFVIFGSQIGRDPRVHCWGERAWQRDGLQTLLHARTLMLWRRQCAQLPGEMIENLQHWLYNWKPSAADMREFIGCYLTEPKASVWFERPEHVRIRHFQKQSKRNGVKLDRRTRISFSGRVIYVNGEPWVSDRPLSRGLKQLANQRRLDGSAFSALATDDQDSLAMWHEAGWLHPLS